MLAETKSDQLWCGFSDQLRRLRQALTINSAGQSFFRLSYLSKLTQCQSLQIAKKSSFSYNIYSPLVFKIDAKLFLFPTLSLSVVQSTQSSLLGGRE